MQPFFDLYRHACRTISILTNLEVQVYNVEKHLQIHAARFELPTVLEPFRQQALEQVLSQLIEPGQVRVIRSDLQLEFLTAGLWQEKTCQGTVVVGPAISRVFHSQTLQEMSQSQRIPLVMQKHLQQSYNSLPIVDEAKLHAIATLLVTLFTTDLPQPQISEVPPLPLSSEEPSRSVTTVLEQNQGMIEKRYAIENNILHSITAGDLRLLQEALKGRAEIPWSFRHGSHVRTLKNLALAGNTLFRKAAEQGGVHPLYLDSLSGKFAIQIEQAQSLAELSAISNVHISIAYCNLVREMSVVAYPPLIREAITQLRFHLDQPLSLNALAEILGVNSSHLSRSFKKALGMTLSDYVNQFRIEEAKYLLDHSNDAVTEIALAVGFNDANYFSKVFRRWEHITPLAYRQRKKEKLALEQD